MIYSNNNSFNGRIYGNYKLYMVNIRGWTFFFKVLVQINPTIVSISTVQIFNGHIKTLCKNIFSDL